LEKLYEYLKSVSVREPAILRRLREETASLPNAGMQVPPEHGQFLAFLVQLMGARRTLEVGVFTGYSSLAVALALPRDGRIVACDVSEEYTSIARRYWKEAGVDHMIELRIKPALETLKELLSERQQGRFDFAFIDADKANYDAYYESCLTLLRAGGIIALDNMLWSGKVADPNVHDADTDALRSLNAKIRDDARVDACLLTVGDGVMLAQKRGT
jgi:caffeoyl-CoA O-methyltransferase